MECSGARAFLKDVQKGVHRFTVLSAERELKLRASARLTPTEIQGGLKEKEYRQPLTRERSRQVAAFALNPPTEVSHRKSEIQSRYRDKKQLA